MYACIASLQSIWVIVYLFVRLSACLSRVLCYTFQLNLVKSITVYATYKKCGTRTSKSTDSELWKRITCENECAVQSYLSVCLSIQSIWFVSNMCFPVCSTWDRYKILGVYHMRSMGFLRWGYSSRSSR